MRVYLDNAATTQIAPQVIDVMLTVIKDNFGNPSSTHFFGRNAKALVENARRSVAKHMNCLSSEIIFTSGGTEADNMAIHAAVNNLGVKRIISSSIEHHAVGHTIESLTKENLVESVFVKIDSKGHVNLNHLEELLQENIPTLVSLMHANNEIATLLPLKKVAQLCRKYKAYFHSDTVQTIGHYPIDLQDLDIDFIACSAHKFHGPKGIGFIYVNKKTKISPFVCGGAQERGLRGGTENIVGIVGLAKAMELAYKDLEEHQNHVQALKSHMMDELKILFPSVLFHGETETSKSLYTVLNVCFPKTEKGGMLLFTLDLKGVAVSGGSACNSGANKGSHVLEGIGADITRPNARFSFSHYTTKEEIDYTLKQIKSVFDVNIR